MCDMFTIFHLDQFHEELKSLSDGKLDEEYSKIQERKKHINSTCEKLSSDYRKDIPATMACHRS